MRALVLLTALLAACGGPPGPQPLPATLVEATVEQQCLADGGARCAPVELFLSAPHCGHDLTALDPSSSAATIDTADPASSLLGVWEVRTTALDAQGLGRELEPRRAVLSSRRPEALVYPVLLGQSALYQLSATGQLTPVPDAGDVQTDDAGAVVFTWEREAPDAGTVRFVERHRVTATWQVEATVRDHSGDPFYGCCAHVGGLTPVVGLTMLLLVRRRRRRAAARR